MKGIPFVLLVCTSSLYAETIRMNWHLYSAEPKIGAALEQRLMAGGAPALEAFMKLPEMIRQGRIEEVESFSMELESGQRLRGKSSEGSISLPFHESTAGLDIEVDAVVSGDLLNFNLHVVYACQTRDGPLEQIVTTQALSVEGVPTLICRWHLGDEWLILVSQSTFGGGEGEILPSDLIFVESAIYPNVNAASAERDCLASTLIPTRSGQRSQTEMIFWIDDENLPERDQPGFRSLIDPTLIQAGGMELEARFSYIEEAGGRTRLDSGERVRRLAIREVSDVMALEEGEWAGRRTQFAANEDIETEEDDHVAAFRYFSSSGSVP
ncbi:MAG: hypothetical protein AAGA96_13280 [Verrucomicrobiota bacterium]